MIKKCSRKAGDELRRFCNAHLMHWVMVLTVSACLAALFLNLYTGKELLYETFAVILGVIVTAIITMLLLHGQTEEQRKADLSKEIDQKVYEEKLKIYQEFLKNLCEALKDGEIDEAEKTKLIFDTAAISMHTSMKRVMEISKGVCALVHTTNATPENREEAEGIEKTKLAALFRIVNSFRQELYTTNEERAREWEEDELARKKSEEKPEEQAPDKDIDEQINKLLNEGIDEDKEEARSAITYANELTHPFRRNEREFIKKALASALDVLKKESGAAVTFASAAGNIRSWEEALEQWRQDGWICNTSSQELEMSRPDVPGTLGILFQANHYTFFADYRGSCIFARDIKSRYKKGRRTYGKWWYHFEGEYHDMPQGSFAERIGKDASFLQYVVTSLNGCMKHLLDQYEVLGWWQGVKELMQNQKPEWLENDELWHMNSWNLFVFYCNYRKEAEGVPFMDTYRDDSGKSVIIELYNRKNNEELLRQTLARLSPEPEKLMQQRTPGKRILLETIDVSQGDAAGKDKVAQAIFGYMKKLAAP